MNEIILRYICAFWIVCIAFLRFLWRTAAEETEHYKTLAETISESLAKLTHEYHGLMLKIENALQKVIGAISQF